MDYTDGQAIQDLLGREFDAIGLVQADASSAAVTALIDRYTGQTWQPRTVVGELHTVLGRVLYLASRPVSAVSSVTARPSSLGSVSTTLLGGTGYELLDANAGALLVGASVGSLVVVTYTTTPMLPADVGLAATMWAANLLGPTLDPSRSKFSSVASGTERLVYRDDPDGPPPQVAAILNAYRSALVFA